MPDRLVCASCLVYAKKPASTDAAKIHTLIRHVKEDRVDPSTGLLWAERMVDRIAQRLPPEWHRWLGLDVSVVPVPGAHLTRPDTVWPALTICRAMVRAGLAGSVTMALTRRSAVPKSAGRSSRPTLVEHLDSLGVQPTLDMPGRLVLVDDVVTRGTTMMAAERRLRSASVSTVDIFAFAVARTADHDEAGLVFAPQLDVIMPRGFSTVRRRLRRF